MPQCMDASFPVVLLLILILLLWLILIEFQALFPGLTNMDSVYRGWGVVRAGGGFFRTIEQKGNHCVLT